MVCLILLNRLDKLLPHIIVQVNVQRTGLGFAGWVSSASTS